MSNYYALDLTGTETTKKDFFKNGPFRGWHFCGPIGNITGGFCGTRKGSRFHTEPTIKKGIVGNLREDLGHNGRRWDSEGPTITSEIKCKKSLLV